MFVSVLHTLCHLKNHKFSPLIPELWAETQLGKRKNGRVSGIKVALTFTFEKEKKTLKIITCTNRKSNFSHMIYSIS